MLTHGRPSKKCKDFMKNFPKNFDPIFGVAVAVDLPTARQGMDKPFNMNFSYHLFYKHLELLLKIESAVFDQFLVS